MSRLPVIQTAIIADPAGALVISHDAPVPSLQPDMVLVRTAVVALNPVDTKMVDRLAYPGALSGFDFAGTVVAIGSAVTKPGLKVGDRVCGAVHGMNPLVPEVGAFAKYVGAIGHAILTVPDWMTCEDASTIGVGIGTVGLALFRSLNVPGDFGYPVQKPLQILVYGASTSVGTLAVQMLKK